ncbi:unnamed protein product [Blepharisma stoltei]|uniref:Uncharacterized protein n=1 Tax=Blepharisma stoltei TaxID=1481888 RepID=A0AAU9K6N2_9CILI|nr:unnamed protein product [Blepharisma stoltei]
MFLALILKDRLLFFICYFSSSHANALFPSITPSENCKFKMKWKYDSNNANSYSFECIDIYGEHNHRAIPETESQSLIECEILSEEIRNEAIKYYYEGFTVKQIQLMVNTNNRTKISKSKIENLTSYYAKKNFKEFTFESLVESKLRNENSIINYDRLSGRFFIFRYKENQYVESIKGCNPSRQHL